LRNEPNWLPLEVVLKVNQDAVSETGENYFLRDRSLLESALGKAQNHWIYGEDDVVVLAVQLLAGIVQNHCFEQGNKRTAFIVFVMFLKANGYNLTVPDGEIPLGHWITGLVAKGLGIEQFTELIRPFVKAL
jgi:death-on-curing protein